MLTTSFKNYDEFKELFVATKENGETRRKNGVLLSFLTSKEVRKHLKQNYNHVEISLIANMNAMLDILKQMVSDSSYRWRCGTFDTYYCLYIMDVLYYSDTYKTDGKNGICVDGDFSAYRYQNMKREGRVFKMKVGKMFRHIIDISELNTILPESVKLWFCEEMTRQWEAYSASRQPSNLVLHVDDDFCSIYDGDDSVRDCAGYFKSCMQGSAHENWMFYRDSVKAKAAYLTENDDEDSLIVARCIIFTEVTRGDTGEVIRVAERQYSTDGDEVLQRMLVKKLIDGGYIDAYKKTGAGCGDASAFVDINGNDMSGVELSIRCYLESGDHLSYQDSFKWYDQGDNVAYNHYHAYLSSLEDTSDYFNYEEEDLNWDSWHEYDTENDVVEIYYRGREYTCDEENIPEDFHVSYAGDHEGCYVHIDDLYWCDDIDDYVEEGYYHYSEILDETYYDEEQMAEDEDDYKERYWFFSEWDGDYCEDEDDLTEIIVRVLSDGTFERQSIFRETLDNMLMEGTAVMDEETEIAYTKAVIDKLAA